LIELAKARQKQTADKYRTIQAELKRDNFEMVASRELIALQNIQKDIDDDINRQRFRAHKGAQRIAWTMAPTAYANLRGKHQKGAILGSG